MPLNGIKMAKMASKMANMAFKMASFAIFIASNIITSRDRP